MMKKSTEDQRQHQTFWVYILLCSNNTYYTGYTNDLDKRYASHLKGVASKYTRSFKPVNIAQSWKVENGKSLAMKIEAFIKGLTRFEKDAIVINPSYINSKFGLSEKK